ncbi:hypothetical protein POTOM_018777 [Populus tomentosa]|uniref:RNA polymerase Rpb4/RPC9 core domain-containing protein n=1 Tax=Populus tomentosa TaxID=118781 RepID=A0A8X7ZQQ4_POPTO|nr:hypothetical protein POTOM_018777 [Populus tomentosa]
MCRKNPNAGALTNFEVLDFLRSRGASRDVSRVLAPVAASEYKVYDYLVETPACNLTREKINEFLERCKKYDLAKAELLNIINIRPSQTVEIYTLLANLLYAIRVAHRADSIEFGRFIYQEEVLDMVFLYLTANSVDEIVMYIGAIIEEMDSRFEMPIIEELVELVEEMEAMSYVQCLPGHSNS